MIPSLVISHTWLETNLSDEYILCMCHVNIQRGGDNLVGKKPIVDMVGQQPICYLA